MSGKKQNVRRSQFIFGLGPGALIETTGGPRIIPALSRGLGRAASYVKDFEIDDCRLQMAIGTSPQDDIRIFQMPADSSMGGYREGIYRTFSFPTWKVCYGPDNSHPILYDGFAYDGCPVCKKKGASSVRFVLACEDGHLDDLDWNCAVHQDLSSRCDPRYLLWKGGSSFSSIVITCPICKKSTSMSQIHGLSFKCSGRLPEKESSDPANFEYTLPIRRGCGNRMRVLWRQSSSLRLAETITLLTLPDFDTPIDRIMGVREKAAVLNMALGIADAEKTDELKMKKLQELLAFSKLTQDEISQLMRYVKKESFKRLESKIKNMEVPKTAKDLIFQEFESLSNNGGTSPTPNFSMGAPKRYVFNGVELDVHPIDRLRTVTAQTGYVRMVRTGKEDSEPKRVDIGMTDVKTRWYPGFLGTGEGIFIKLAGSLPKLDIKSGGEWIADHSESKYKPSRIWDVELNKPLFVWLHTVSHALINQISYYSGYSAASMRERVYVNYDLTGGGILIYTTSPGQDGSMGGLMELVMDFQPILDSAYEKIMYCSNDPLCEENRKKSGRINGAACHSCVLASETSCEYRNASLDRHVVIGD